MTASPSSEVGPPASSPTDAASDAKRPRFMTKKAIEGMETLKKEGRGELNSRTPDARIANLKKYVEEQANKQGKAVEAGWWEKGWTITIVPRQNDPSNKDPVRYEPLHHHRTSRCKIGFRGVACTSRPFSCSVAATWSTDGRAERVGVPQYYFTPEGMKLRSMINVFRYLVGEHDEITDNRRGGPKDPNKCALQRCHLIHLRRRKVSKAASVG